MYETIEALQALEESYFIDFIPYDIADSKFLELELFFEDTYLSQFSEKLARIALKLIYYYPCEIYLTEAVIPSSVEKFDFPFDVNIRDHTPNNLSYVIQQIVSKDFSSVQILFTAPQFLISFYGGFSNSIYQPSDESLQILKRLVAQEGLFLKHKNVMNGNFDLVG